MNLVRFSRILPTHSLPMPTSPTRRDMLSQSIAAAGLAAMAQTATAAETPSQQPFAIALNTSTIRGQKLPLAAEIEIAARAGFQGIEPWMNEIDEHVRSGGSAADLRKRIADAGLKVAGVIAF